MTVEEVINRLIRECRGDLSVPVLIPCLDNNGLLYDGNIRFVDRAESSDGSLKSIIIR